MSTFAAALKKEIARIARKVVREETTATRTASSRHRKDIAELKRQIASLTREVERLKKNANRPGHAPNNGHETKNGSARRFSAKGLRSHREKLELSAADYAELVGVSSLTIYNWEHERTRPQAAQLESLAEVRKLGKREAYRRLETD